MSGERRNTAAAATPPSGEPPHDLEAEAWVLGCVLRDPTAFARLGDLLGPDDFYRQNNGRIYRSAEHLHREGLPIDQVSLAAELEKRDELTGVGGRAHLALLYESTPTTANVEYCARRVRALAVKRRIGDGVIRVVQAVRDPRAELDDVGDQIDVLREWVSGETGWLPPLPLVELGALPKFPLEQLPGWCTEFAAALSEATQTPPDLAGMMVLACLATCVGGRARVEIKPGWEEPLNLYVLVALPPGERKSAVVEAATAPLSEFEEERARALDPIITEAAIRRRALERSAEAAETAAAKAVTDQQRETAIERAAELAQQAQSVVVPAPYRLLADDATPEILATLLSQQGGRIAVLSAEGDVVGQMAGRYSQGRVAGTNLGVYLKGHAGDRLRVDRVGRPSEYVPRPAITLGLAVQPEVLRMMTEVPHLGGLGVLARFLYSLPASRMGERDPDAEPIPAAVAHEYASRLSILARNLDAAGGGCLVRFSAAGRRLLTDHAARLEPRLGESGDLRHMRDWAGKLSGAIARVATLIHLAANVRGAWGDEVPAAAVESAICIGDYAVEHARAVFNLMGADPQVELARRVLRWIGDRGHREFKRRDAFDQLRDARLVKVTDLDPALQLLVAHGYLAPVASAGGPGRPSPRFRVNPLAQNPQNTQNGSPEGGIAGSAGFALRRPDEGGMASADAGGTPNRHEPRARRTR